MPSIIDFSNYSVNERVFSPPHNSIKTNASLPTENHVVSHELQNIQLEENKQRIEQRFPDKILFTMKETALELNISYEFIRKKVKDDAIPCVCLGDRRMIHKSTIIQLLTYGIK